MFALKIKTSVSTLQGVDNASRGDIRRKWRNEAVVPPPAPAHPAPFSRTPWRLFRVFIRSQYHGDEYKLVLTICPPAIYRCWYGNF